MIRALGHRGAMLDRVENTLPSFHEAIRQGATGLELDVRRSGSGELVVFHDEDLGRLAGRSLKVSETALVDLRQVDLRDPLLPGLTSRLCSLDDLLTDPTLAGMLSDRKRPFDLFVELKADDLEQDLVRVIRSRNLADRVFFISFQARRLERIRSLGQDLRTSLLFSGRREEHLSKALAIGCTALNPEPQDADGGFVDRARGAGLLVTVGQTTDPATIRRLLDLDVWGIHSDRPGLVVEALEAKNSTDR